MKVYSGTPLVPEVVPATIIALDHEGNGTGIIEAATHLTSSTEAARSIRVPFTVPGERVRARIWRRGADGAVADLVEVLTPAQERVAAPCPLFGACGGCQLQHLAYGRQLDWKTAVVRDLAAALGLGDRVAPCIGSPRQLGYRSKITPHHDRPRADASLAIGFLKVGRKHEVIDVVRCPLATDGINARLPALREAIVAAAPRSRLGASFLIREAASGVTTDPDARVTERIAGLELEFFAREFFQNNPFLLPALVQFVVGAATSGGAPWLVDAYTGSGLFALAAAARFTNVFGVEVSPSAVRAARENAARNGITNARFVAADAARIFGEIDCPGAEAAVIVDPPRKGCGDAFLSQLVAFGPATIVYVSCNPETLMRDIAVLMSASYETRTLQPFDMFPQTRHVECVAVLRRRQPLPDPSAQ